MTTVPVTLQDTSSPHVFSVLLPHKKIHICHVLGLRVAYLFPLKKLSLVIWRFIYF